MASSDDIDKKISQLRQELVTAYKKSFVFYWEGKEGGVCAEGRWVKKKAILA